MKNETARREIESLDYYLQNHTNDYSEESHTAMMMAVKALEKKRRKGHWIKVTNGRDGHECDLCHEYAPSYQSGDEYLTKYCPNCGTKMGESEVLEHGSN